MKIVTKKGDKGKTRNINGSKIWKSSKEIEFVGAVDELQSFLGLLEPSDEIKNIQWDLYLIMGNKKVNVEDLDDYISMMKIPEINKFILPTGMWHVCRTVCRRAERRAVRIGHSSVPYLNRLSDYLYIKSFNL